MSGGRAGAPVGVMRALIRWLPPHLRNEHGEGILETFVAAWDARRERGRLDALAFTLRTAIDLVWTAIRERIPARRSGGSRHGSGVGDDTVQAIRSLARAPVFTLTALLVLALGIGVNASIFTALRLLVLTPPPYAEADRVVVIRMASPAGAPEGSGTLWSYPAFRMLAEADSPHVAPVAGFLYRSANVTLDGESVRVAHEFVSHSYLTLLGARPQLGRLFSAEEDDPSSPELVAVISHRFWMSAFGGSPDVVDRVLPLGSRQARIVGVADDRFVGLTGPVDAWLPLTMMSPALVEQAGASWFQVVGRLAPSASRASATSWADAMFARIRQAYPTSGGPGALRASVIPLPEARTRPEARAAVWAMAGAALLVLLVGCVNVAGLLIARGTARTREIAVRMAMGAARARVLRQLLWESLAIALSGGALGVLVAFGGTRLLRSYWPARFSSDASGWLRALDVETLRVDPAALLFAGALTLATAVLFGVLPAVRLAGTVPGDALKSASGRGAGAAPRMGGRSALVACEVALALVLLIGAGLMTASMIRLLGVERGFADEGLLMFRYALTRGDDDDGALAERHARFLERLAQDPRIEAAGLSACPAPLSGWCRQQTLPARGDGAPDGGATALAGVHEVSEGYFDALGTRVLEGRTFTDADGAGGTPVAVVNRSAARALFGGESPIGRVLPLPVAEDRTQPVVVGVVEDVLQARPEVGATPEIYLPFGRSPSLRPTAFVRTSARPLDLVPEIAAHLEALEPSVRVTDASTGSDLIARVTTDRRALLWLMGVFAGSAVVLTAVGIWSVVAYAASQRTREIGVRMALGARSYQVIGLVARSGGRAVLAGILAGLGGAYLASRTVRAIVFGVEPTEPSVYVAASVILALVALLASLHPALRATRVDPVRAMRVE